MSDGMVFRPVCLREVCLRVPGREVIFIGIDPRFKRLRRYGN
jgi:hypothetical protein